MTRHIKLPGSAKSSDTLKVCDRCRHDREPSGGVAINPTKWYCSNCWQIFNARRRTCTA